MVTLQNRLKEKDVPPEVCSPGRRPGHHGYGAPRRPMCGPYAAIVHEKAVLRRLIKINEEIANLLCGKGAAGYDPGRHGKTDLPSAPEPDKAGDFVPIRQVALNVLDKIEQATRSKSTVTGLATASSIWTTGCRASSRSDLILIAARRPWERRPLY